MNCIFRIVPVLAAGVFLMSCSGHRGSPGNSIPPLAGTTSKAVAPILLTQAMLASLPHVQLANTGAARFTAPTMPVSVSALQSGNRHALSSVAGASDLEVAGTFINSGVPYTGVFVQQTAYAATDFPLSYPAGATGYEELLAPLTSPPGGSCLAATTGAVNTGSGAATYFVVFNNCGTAAANSIGSVVVAQPIDGAFKSKYVQPTGASNRPEYAMEIGTPDAHPSASSTWYVLLQNNVTASWDIVYQTTGKSATTYGYSVYYQAYQPGQCPRGLPLVSADAILLYNPATGLPTFSPATSAGTGSATQTVAPGALVGTANCFTADTTGPATDVFTMEHANSDWNVAPSPPASSVSGVAAAASAIVGAAVSLKDSTGAARTATTGSGGSFTIDTTGMTGPFILTTLNGTTKLYSVTADTNGKTTANITPLTDLVARSWYNAQSANIDAAFASSSPNAPPPIAVTSITGAMQNIFQLWLTKAGVAPGFNVISTPFSANGTGVALVLSQTTVNQSAAQIHITDGSTTQDTTITYPANAMTATTTTTGPGGTSSSSNTTVVPVQAGQQAAIAAIQTSLTAFANVITSKGAALQAADLLPYLDPNLLLDGKNATQTATDFAAQVAGSSAVFTLQQVKQLDSSSADIIFKAAFTQGGQTQNKGGEFFFKLVGGSWLFSGNGRRAHISVQSESATNQGTSTQGSGPDINVDIDSPHGTVSGGTVSGGFLSTTNLVPGPIRVRPSGQYDTLFYNTGIITPAQVPTAGTIFSVNLSTTAGPVSYAIPINAATSESVRITNPTGTTLASANLGSPLAITWTLPTTYAIAEVQISALSFTGPQSSTSTYQCETNAIVGPTATSVTLTIPPTCNGQSVQNVNLNLGVTGINGERSFANYFMQ